MRIGSSAAAYTVGSIDDLLMQIISCLPAKSLARFKLVSKHWESLINSHYDRGPVGLICPNLNIHIFEYIPLNPAAAAGPPFWVLRFGADTSTRPYWIHQSCNGLLLCCCRRIASNFPHNDYEHPRCCWSPMPTCCVFNPTTKRFVKISSPSGASQTVLGVNLAFDPARSPSYKVVCVRGSAPQLVRIEMYLSELGAWRVCGEPFNATATFNYGVFWNESIHWISYRLKKIFYFNVYEEEHGDVMLPSTISGGYETVEQSIGYFGESRDHLHIVESCGHGQMTTSLNVYEMKRDYSEWLIKYRVDVTKMMTTNVGGISVLSLVRVDEGKKGSFLVLWAGGDKKAIRYNLFFFFDKHTIQP